MTEKLNLTLDPKVREVLLNCLDADPNAPPIISDIALFYETVLQFEQVQEVYVTHHIYFLEFKRVVKVDDKDLFLEYTELDQLIDGGDLPVPDMAAVKFVKPVRVETTQYKEI